MTISRRHVIFTVTALTLPLMAGCGNGSTPQPPLQPGNPTPVVTANAYILPDAVSLGAWAFGDEAVVIYKDERLHWVNADSLTHHIVADSPDETDFRQTDELHPNGGDQSFIMTKLGTTRIHCAIHPNMTGTLIVREH